MKRIDGGLVIAVTGGIACGKSEVSRILEAEGASVLDADQVGHACIEPEGPCFRRVLDEFGNGILDPAGRIDRARLGKSVFADADQRIRLNRIVHPEVMKRCRDWVRQCREQHVAAALTIPLLFEVGETDGWDAIVCVTAPTEQVLERLGERGLSGQEAQQRIDAQMPLQQKEELADFVIRNDGSLKDLREETLDIWMRILNKEIRHHGRSKTN